MFKWENYNVTNMINHRCAETWQRRSHAIIVPNFRCPHGLVESLRRSPPRSGKTAHRNGISIQLMRFLLNEDTSTLAPQIEHAYQIGSGQLILGELPNSQLPGVETNSYLLIYVTVEGKRDLSAQRQIF